MTGIEISFDLSRIDFEKTAAFVGESYWGVTRAVEQSRRAFENSLCAGAYLDGVQVAFARAVTDYAVFAYLADVIVWPEHRGRGIGQQLVRAFLDHPELAQVGHFCLTTVDAQGLYEKFGFVPSTDGRYMRLDRTKRA
jgi:ribosomal protein S18 acetylase RimI-like enzyme